jgi:NADH-quinone oxidoreductase subunit N
MNISMIANLSSVATPLWVVLIGVIVLLLDLKEGAAKRRGILPILSAVLLAFGVVLSFVTNKDHFSSGRPQNVFFGGGIVADDLALWLDALLCFVAALVCLMAGDYLKERGIRRGEFYALVLFSTAGAMVMVHSYDLVNVFVGLEVLSVALYVLAGYARREQRSQEAAVKYFLLGSFASAFLLFGIALIYGSVGIAAKSLGLGSEIASYTQIGTIANVLERGLDQPGSLIASPLFVIGVALFLVGLGFKASLVPFHNYAPDVYEGAPTPVTAFLSVAAKIASFAVLMRFFVSFSAVGEDADFLRTILGTMATLTILLGNIMAFRQTIIKRMLAYSSVAHAGYLLLGVLAMTFSTSRVTAVTDPAAAVTGMVFYLFAYALMNMGIFAGIIAVARRGKYEVHEISDLHGLGKRDPMTAFSLTVALLSLAGIPLTAGFLGKLEVFLVTLQSVPGLTIIALITSALGVFYYLGLVAAMYFKPAKDADTLPLRGGMARIVALIAAILTLAMGLGLGKEIMKNPQETEKTAPPPEKTTPATE